MGIKDRQYDDEGRVIRTNKEAEKRKRDEIKTFVKTLFALSDDKYGSLPIDQRLREALNEGKRLTGNAHKRHLSFVVRLVHEQDFDAIRTAHERVHHSFRNDPAKIREVESYRDRLIGGDKATVNAVIDELLTTFADIDIQYLRQLARNAKKEQELAQQREADASDTGIAKIVEVKATKSTKLLYHYLFKLELL